MSISHQILIIGGGAAGLATAASLHKRDASLDIAVVEPADKHYYQPGWTMVGAGVFEKSRHLSGYERGLARRRETDQK